MIAKIARFGPFVLSYLKCDLHQKLILSRVVCNEYNYVINFAKIHKLLLRYIVYKIGYTERDTDTVKYIISRRRPGGADNYL